MEWLPFLLYLRRQSVLIVLLGITTVTGCGPHVPAHKKAYHILYDDKGDIRRCGPMPGTIVKSDGPDAATMAQYGEQRSELKLPDGDIIVTEWSFVRRRGEADLYEVKFQLGKAAPTEYKDIELADDPVEVFQYKGWRLEIVPAPTEEIRRSEEDSKSIDKLSKK